MKKEAKVVFADRKLKRSYEKLEGSKTEDQELYKWLSRAFDDLAENAFCGIQIPKKLIPKDYVRKYGIDNLWKYDLPRAWRLLYSIADGEVKIIAIVLEWMNHKEYERKFGY